MNKINVNYPDTENNVLNKIAKEYLDLRIHEFKEITSKLDNSESFITNDILFHKYHNISSLNIEINTSYHQELKREFVSFHTHDNNLITIEDIIDFNDYLESKINLLDANNFYLSEYGIIFLSFKNNQIIKTLIPYDKIKRNVNNLVI